MEVEPPQVFGMKKDTNKQNKQRKVFVGLSGGVDSATALALLQKQGYSVTGVFIKVWQPDFVECQWKEDRLDAMRICAILDVPFLELDLEKEYKRAVFEYMLAEYKKGRTPNPDVMCNKKIKFGAFLDFALKNGADFIATGHYTRLRKGQLLMGLDTEKDQSYFLWTLTPTQLNRCLFPIGDYQKTEVRKLAEKFQLPVARKKDSQGLCFVGKVNMKEFLQRFLPQTAGAVVNTTGEKIGEHDGVQYYTIGQRHGFLITRKGTSDKPYYIIAKDLRKNTLTVSNDFLEKAMIQSQKKQADIKLKEVNWISGAEPNLRKKYSARIRYRQIPQVCALSKNARQISVKFEKPQNVAEGQSLVIYDGELCLGGGVIW